MTNKKVYFISDGRGHVKIGCSANPEARMASLQTATALKLTMLGWVPGGLNDERYLHEAFSHAHVMGEWFRLDRALRKFGEYLVEDWRADMTIPEAVVDFVEFEQLQDLYPTLYDQNGWADAVQAAR